MRRLRAKDAVCLLAAAVALTSPAQAAVECWNPEQAIAAKLRDLQSRLIAATLRCRAARHDIVPSYNEFVRANISGLQGANALLKSRFEQGYGATGAAEYDRFVTRLANRYGAETTDQAHCEAMRTVAEEAAAARGDAGRLLAIGDRLAIGDPLGTELKLAGGQCAASPALVTASALPSAAPAAPAPAKPEAAHVLAVGSQEQADGAAPAQIEAAKPLKVNQDAGASASTVALQIDVHEVENGAEVLVELPGVAQADIDVQLVGKVVTIAGQKRRPAQDGELQHAGRAYGSFERAVPLSFEPDPNQVRARLNDGVLTITLLRSAQETSRKIEVRTGDSPVSE